MGHLIAFLCAMLACASCVAPANPVFEMGPAASPGAPLIVAVTPKDNRLSDRLVTRFAEEVGVAVVGFQLTPSARNSAVTRAIRLRKPALVLAVGADAARYLEEQGSTVPVIHLLAVQDETSRPSGDTTATIALEVPPRTAFFMYKAILSDIRRVLVFYTAANSTRAVGRATEQLKEIGIELTAVPVRDGREIETAFSENVAGHNAVWLLSDRALLTVDTFVLIRRLADAQGIPLLCPFEQFVAAGGLMSVDPDYDNMASQAASIARQLLENSPSEALFRVHQPVGARLIVNTKVVRRLGIEIQPQFRPIISKMLE